VLQEQLVLLEQLELVLMDNLLALQALKQLSKNN
jgi:hypothetical protein